MMPLLAVFQGSWARACRVLATTLPFFSSAVPLSDCRSGLRGMEVTWVLKHGHIGGAQPRPLPSCAGCCPFCSLSACMPARAYV